MKRSTFLLPLLCSALLAALAPFALAQGERGAPPLRVEVAEIPGRFVFEGPTHEDGMPAHGATFLTQGYIYEAGTLRGEHGVAADGSPAFPARVIGLWTCRGWFIGDGAHTERGPAAITTQLFAFDESYSGATVVTEGYEVMQPGTPFTRVIVGGSGGFDGMTGTMRQTLVGMTEEMLVSYAFEIAPAVAERGE